MRMGTTVTRITERCDLGLGEVCEFPSAHDGEELEDAGHGHAVGAGQGGQHRHQQQRPVRDVGVQQREHVNSAQGREADRY